MTKLRKYVSLAVLTGAVLLIAVDATVMHLAVPSLTRDLGATATEVLWIGDVYSFAIAGLLITMGNVADRIGRKRLLLIGSAAFGIASVAAALAPTPEALIAARLALGAAGATLMPSTLSLIRNIFTDPAERTRAIAIWSAAAASGIALGPVVGGALLEHFWWGSVFLINVPVIVLILAVGWPVLPESRNPERHPIDLLSSALSMLAIVPFVYAIKHAASGGFDLALVASALLAVVGAWLFIRRQRRADEPMIDVSLFANGAFSGAVAVNFISVFAMSGVLFFFSQYLQLARGLGTLEAGLAQLPAALASLVAVAFVGVLLARLGRGRAIALALAVGAAGLVTVALVEGAEQLVWVLLALVPLGLGIGVSETLSVDAVVSAVPKEKAGAASSISETAYEFGTAMGIAVLGSVTTVIYRIGLPVDAPDAVRESLATASASLGDGPALEAAREAFVTAIQATTLIGAAVMLVGAFVALRLIPSGKGSEGAVTDAGASGGAEASVPGAGAPIGGPTSAHASHGATAAAGAEGGAPSAAADAPVGEAPGARTGSVG
ncbi:MFS transporter [Microbacterium halophytorum]|uniref:MFS transporter n=1 Tax=Microbacterium halophytorum TaxID=2067568 RepID=UPI000CFCB117|nr:MFS transporter [Microbacterium halophytorum]